MYKFEVDPAISSGVIALCFFLSKMAIFEVRPGRYSVEM
jgi:hypothetical protein